MNKGASHLEIAQTMPHKEFHRRGRARVLDVATSVCCCERQEVVVARMPTWTHQLGDAHVQVAISFLSLG